MMRRIVLPVEDRGIGDGRGDGGAGATAGSVTLVLPETRSEYEKARAEVESLARAARGNEVTGPADGGRDGMDGTYAMPGAGRWVVTTGKQRRAWDLPDLGGVATVPAFTHADLQRAWRRDTVPLVDADDAVRLLAGNDAGSRADNETGGVGGTRVSGSVRSEHAAAEFVNLKHGRGPIPAHVRETLDELSGRLRIDALVSARTATTSSPGSSGSCPSAALGSSSASSSRRSWPRVLECPERPEHRRVGRPRRVGHAWGATVSGDSKPLAGEVVALLPRRSHEWTDYVMTGVIDGRPGSWQVLTRPLSKRDEVRPFCINDLGRRFDRR